MKRYHKRFLALCLSASMLVSPLSYTRAYASEETSITENSSQNETVAESENKSESQSPAAEEAGNASSQEKENASNNNSNTADAEKSGSVAVQQESQQTAETGQVQSEASDGENVVVQTANAPTVTSNTVQVVKEDGNVFAMFKITTSTVKKNGELYDVSFTTSSNSYDKIYLGSIDLFYREGADAWFTREPSEYLPRGVKCETCGCTELTPEKDILDVWWESGVSHTSVLKHREAEGLRFPADMYLEGSDQHRGWFQSSLLTSMGAYGVPPYKAVMHCGFTVDGEGRKMSKSLGNGVDPAEVMAKSGADVLRLWVASVDYSQDVSISDEILQRTSEAYRRIRNTFRFLLGSLDDFDDQKDAVSDWNALEPLDQWAMVRTKHLLDDVSAAYDAYKLHYVYRAVYDYIVNDLSAVYMDATKDRLYSEAPDSPRRRAVQTVLMNILEVLVRVLAPVLSFTTDEVWEHYPQAMRERAGRPTNVQLAGWPKASDFAPAIPADGERVSEDFGVIMGVREVVTKALEDARGQKVVNKSQEAAVVVTAPRAVLDAVERYDAAVFEELFIVASVSFAEGEELAATVSKTEAEKCPRCWNHRALGGNANHGSVCERCGDALDAIGFAEGE